MFGVGSPLFYVKRYSFWGVIANKGQFGSETPLFLKIGHQQRVLQPRTNPEGNLKKYFLNLFNCQTHTIQQRMSLFLVILKNVIRWY
jgi:hypothetical protein